MKSYFFLLLMACTSFTSVMAMPLPVPTSVVGKFYNLDFTLVNKTGYDINEVFVSPTKMKDWGEDIMGRDVLPDGESVDITFDSEETSRKWDIYVTWVGYDEDEDVFWTGFDLSKISKITLYYDLKTGKTWAETE
ncbi:MAG: hypothetical protein LW630_08045 [Saprospiraceae bacterium]|jgi:hypothetical protein|nr:hypothetical protein [Saprospiraceae bacterium]